LLRSIVLGKESDTALIFPVPEMPITKFRDRKSIIDAAKTYVNTFIPNS
jgi:hypothetical protein